MLKRCLNVRNGSQRPDLIDEFVADPLGIPSPLLRCANAEGLVASSFAIAASSSISILATYSCGGSSIFCAVSPDPRTSSIVGSSSTCAQQRWATRFSGSLSTWEQRRAAHRHGCRGGGKHRGKHRGRGRGRSRGRSWCRFYVCRAWGGHTHCESRPMPCE